jgi:hypothetical protein
VIDDELDMTTILERALERVGFTVDRFNDPVSALEGFKPNLTIPATLFVNLDLPLSIISSWSSSSRSIALCMRED